MSVRRSYPDPPEGAERFVVAHKSVRVSVNRLVETLDLDDADDVAEEFDLAGSGDLRAGGAVVFTEGETLPAAIGRADYSAFYDRLAVFDGAGNRLDEADVRR